MTPSAVLPPEVRLVAACCGAPRDDGLARRVRRAADAVPDWGRVLRVVARQRVAGLVEQGLRLAEVAVPPEAAGALRRKATAQARLNLMLAAESLRLDRALAAAGVDAAVLKGVALGRILYGDVGLRHSKDVDLLVAADAVPAALAVLERAGYRLPRPLSASRLARTLRAAHHLSVVHPERRVEVELHWRFAENRHLLPEIPPPSRWVAVEVSPGASVRTLAREDLFCYLCVHGAQHAWFRLKWLADIAAILAAESEDGLLALIGAAEDRGVARAAAQAVLLAKLVLDAEVPPRVLAALPQGRAVRSLVATGFRLLTGDGQAEPADLPFGTTRINASRYRIRGGLRYWLAEAWGKVEAPADWPPLAAPVYPLVYPPLWLGRHLLGKRNEQA